MSGRDLGVGRGYERHFIKSDERRSVKAGITAFIFIKKKDLRMIETTKIKQCLHPICLRTVHTQRYCGCDGWPHSTHDSIDAYLNTSIKDRHVHRSPCEAFVLDDKVAYYIDLLPNRNCTEWTTT
jgi:hypothetical protein